jgi:hypothetical protein
MRKQTLPLVYKQTIYSLISGADFFSFWAPKQSLNGPDLNSRLGGKIGRDV